MREGLQHQIFSVLQVHSTFTAPAPIEPDAGTQQEADEAEGIEFDIEEQIAHSE